jgi:folylpolyglutamate synthase/dihydropteroate synthase
MPGRFQAINSALAVAAVEQLPDVVVSDDLIAAGLSMARLPGRFEVVQREPLVVLDGAHNPDKIAAFVRELPLLHGVEPGGKLMAVVGSLAAKNHEAIIAALANDVDALMLTSPQVLAKPSAHASALAEEARRSGFAGLIEIEPDPRRAFDRALDLAGPRDAVLVTGSLYLLGNLRGRWFPDEEIAVQRTPWPTPVK